MLFKAPDGTEFDSKKLYRDYMMLNFLTFKNKSDVASPMIKVPGDVNGQDFEISDCTNSTLVVMDTTDQVQIDNLVSCRVFIGACNSTIFIRNCKDCCFFTCSRQLRLFEVHSSVLHTYCQSEIHIELSSDVQFGPFLGGL